jgi:hypothetical protein
MILFIAGETADAAEKFYKSIIHHINCFFIPVNVPENNLQGIAIKPLIHQFLACAIIFGTGINYISQIVQCSFVVKTSNTAVSPLNFPNYFEIITY